MFLKQMQVSQMAVFAYLVGDEETGEALVIDPAADTSRIASLAKENHLHIKYIVNTHGHVDHIAGNRDMKELTGAEIVIHEADAELLVSTPALYLRMFGAKASRRPTSPSRRETRSPSASSPCKSWPPRGTPRAVCAFWETGWCSPAIRSSSGPSGGPTCPGDRGPSWPVR